MFLQSDQQQRQQQQQQQQQCFPHEFTPSVLDGQGYHVQCNTPSHQPLSMLSSVASLLPSHQHANQGSESIVSVFLLISFFLDCMILKDSMISEFICACLFSFSLFLDRKKEKEKERRKRKKEIK